jgi:hypothetical protein
MKHAPRRLFRPPARRPEPPRLVTMLQDRDALYVVDLTRAPSFAWRAAFLRPPPRLTSKQRAADVGRVQVRGATIHFRTTPGRLAACVRRIDRWIDYANSVVAE